MKTFLEKTRSFFSSLASRFQRKPAVSSGTAATNEPPTSPRKETGKEAGKETGKEKGKEGKTDRFMIISWGITLVIVLSLLGSTILYKNTKAYSQSLPPEATTEPGSQPSLPGDPVTGSQGNEFSSILRELKLKTDKPERARVEPVIYRVSRGDAMLSIAEGYKIESDSILFANPDLDDNPHSLKPGMELTIPPVDGIYYKWEEGDTFDSVAEEFDASAEDIINFTGNNIDLTDPKVEVGTMVLVPGGTRELRNWAADLQTQGRGADDGTGGPSAGNICGGGPVSSGFGWPANSHNISGYGYMPSHLGLDIQADEGEPIYAAGSGIVTQAASGWNYGYGNVIQIDHGNGYVTVYAHLSSINVGTCTPVGQGTVIGASGSTGNAFGAHLHFEVRIGGSNVNPYQIVQ
jgi:murein DD-endopeptidase MepM/ murein hydrolase activator NlpD